MDSGGGDVFKEGRENQYRNFYVYKIQTKGGLRRRKVRRVERKKWEKKKVKIEERVGICA